MNTKLIYLLIPLISSGCLAFMSYDKSQELTDRACLNEKFLEAAGSGSLELMIDLLKRGADINARNNHGNTALHEAAWRGRLACVKALIEAKVDVNACNNDGNTALHEAAKRSHLACVKALIEVKADVNARNNHDETALHLAAIYGHLACVEALIEAKVDLNARDSNGETAFHWAVGRGHLDCVKTLVKCSYTLSPSKEAVCESRKRIFSVLLLFARLRKPLEEGGQLFKDLGNTSLQFEILSKSKLLQNDLIVIFLDELKKEREIKPGLLSRSKEAAVGFLLKKVTEIVSTINVSSMKDEMRDYLSDAKLKELIKEGLEERLDQLKVKNSK